MSRQTIAVITTEVISARMAGPAIRAWHMALALAKAGHEVELLTTHRCDVASDVMACRHAESADLDALPQRVDVVVVQGDVLRRSRKLRDSRCVLIVDLYDPFHLEALELTRGLSTEARRRAIGRSLDVVNEQLRRGDLFLCASERQRDFWLGHLAGVGRVNEMTYGADAALRGLLVIVPFGVEGEPPRRTGPGVRGVTRAIDAEDRVIFWGGGIYNWFDPLTLIHAVDRLRRRDERVKLVFAGVEHPNPGVGQTEMSRRAQELAGRLQLVGSHVFFCDWIDYGARANFLLDADLGVSTHLGHVETAFSFRTRILDYLWAGLPTVATEGDVLSEVLTSAGAGLLVPPNDEAKLAEALARVLYEDDVRLRMAAAAAALAKRFTWPTVLAPLVEFCANPTRSPDLATASSRRAIARGADLMPRSSRARLELALDLARRGAWSELARRARHHMRGTRPLH